MTRLSIYSNIAISTTAGAIAAFVLQSAPASAATLVIAPSTVDASSSTGLALSGGGNFSSTDVFSLEVSGTANFISSDPFITNAAGVLTQPYFGWGLPTGGSVTMSGKVVGALGSLVIGNSTIGYFQLFPTNATNGSGRSNPPTSFSFSNVSLGSIFGTALDTTPTSVLNLVANDGVYGDNLGGYNVSGSITSASTSTSVPEPFTIIGTLIGGTAALRLRKKLKSETLDLNDR